LDQTLTLCADIGAIINYSPQAASPSTTLITYDTVDDVIDLSAITVSEIGADYEVTVVYTLLAPHTSVITKVFKI
jgi:hypothetical protein